MYDSQSAGWKSKIRALADSVSGEDHFPIHGWLPHSFFWPWTHLVEGVMRPSPVFFKRALIYGVAWSGTRLKQLSSSSSPRTGGFSSHDLLSSHWGLGFNMWILKGHSDSVYNLSLLAVQHAAVMVLLALMSSLWTCLGVQAGWTPGFLFIWQLLLLVSNCSLPSAVKRALCWSD